MTDRLDLERSLRSLFEVIEYPSGRGLSDAVGSELRSGARRGVSRRVTWPRRRLIAIALAGALLLIAASAGAARLVIGAIQVKVVPSPVPSALSETGPNLGTQMSIVEAEHTVGFSIRVPSDLGQPDGVFLDQGRVSLAWQASSSLPRIPGTTWGAVLVELRGDAVVGLKEVPQGTSIEPVQVGASRGYFIGGPTDLLLPGGKLFQVPGGVVLWQQGPLTLRLESLLSKDAATNLARSVS